MKEKKKRLQTIEKTGKLKKTQTKNAVMTSEAESTKEELARLRQLHMELRQLNRIYKVLLSLNETIVRVHDIQAIFRESCRILVEEGKLPMAWIGMQDERHGRMEIKAAFGVTGDSLSKIQDSLKDKQQGSRLVEMALSTGKCAVSDQKTGDEFMQSWRDEALMYGFHSCAVFPLLANHKAVGVITIFSEENDFFGGENSRLFTQMAADISVAIENVRSEFKLKSADNALKESEERYQTLIQGASEGILAADLETQKFVFANPAQCRMLGYEKHELEGLSLKDIHPQKDLDSIIDIFRAQARGEITVAPEIPCLRKDGSLLFADISTTSMILNGRACNVGFFSDVTERRRNSEISTSRIYLMQYAMTHSLNDLLEETLNEAEKITGSCIGFYHFVNEDQVSLTLQSWSTRTKAEFCLAEGKGLHYNISEAGVWVDCVYEKKPVIHNDYASLPHRKGTPEGHPSVIRELVVPVIRNNKVRAILGVGNKQENYTEKDVEALLLLADLTLEIAERERAEASLRKQYSTLKGIIDSTESLIFSLDRNYCYTSFNCRHARIMKQIYGVDIALGQNLLDYMLVDMDREAAKHNIDRSLAGENLTEEAYSGEEVLSRRYFRVSHSPIKSENGEIIGVAILSHDLTERKKMEEALQEQQQVFQTLVENSPDIIAKYNTDCQRVYVNPTYLKVARLPQDKLIDSSPDQFSPLPRESAIILHSLIRRVLGTGIAEAVDVIWPREDKVDYWYNI